LGHSDNPFDSTSGIDINKVTNKMTEIHLLLDREKQLQAKLYEKEKRLLGLVSMFLSLGILLTFYYSGFSEWLANFSLGHSIIWTFLIYVVTFHLVFALLSFPLHFYSDYLHEHKWKFSNQTVKSWLWESVKSFLVSLVIAFILLGLLFWIMASYPRLWWLIAGLAMGVISVIFATLIPVVILPLFNKYTPIENPELTSALEVILSGGGLKSSGFFKEDMSKQTKKENAFLAGLGKTRRVVLGDNLMDNMSIPEIESIIAHEVGHYKFKHIWKGMAIGLPQQLLVFFLLDLIMRTLFPEFLSSTRVNLTLLPMMAILVGVLSGLLFTIMSNAISRHFEAQSDRYALENINNPNSFLTALAGLADRNLANAYPSWWVKLLYYSHPPIGERLQMAENFQRKVARE